MSVDSIEQYVKDLLRSDSSINEVDVLNSDVVKSNLELAEKAVAHLIEDYAIKVRTCRHEIASPAIIRKLKDLGNAHQQLDERLQMHIQKLRRSEGTLAGTSDVLEFDAAKGRSDRLVEVIQAKNMWESSLRVVDMMGEGEHNELFGYLVSLKQANSTLAKYVPSYERDRVLESRKDLFLSWFSSAILFAIESNDVTQLENLKEKFDALDRTDDYKKTLAAYVQNKMSLFVEEHQHDLTVLSLLDETFGSWKKLNSMCTRLLGDNGSAFLSASLYESLVAKQDVIREVVKRMIADSEDTFCAAREMAKLKSEFIKYAQKEGDEVISSFLKKLCGDLFEVLGDDFTKHVKSVLFVKINELSQAHTSRAHKKHDWILPLLDQVHSCMRSLVTESVEVFGGDFPQFVVPIFEKGMEQLNTVFRKSDLLNIKDTSSDGRNVEDVNDNLTCLCVSGYLLNMIDDINGFMLNSYSACNPTALGEPALVRNRQAHEKFVHRVVQSKVERMARFLGDPMATEMQRMIVESSAHSLGITLPSFSVTPHNYITTVGHGLLTQMNNIAAYNTDRNFKRSIAVVAGDDLNDEECDLWLLRAVVTVLLDVFCKSVGDIAGLQLAVVRQLNVDVGFLLEALEDLRLQPTVALQNLADSLNELANKL